VDHIDTAACARKGITVSHVPDYGEIPVAEHTFALLLALSRRLREFMVLAGSAHRFTYAGARAFDLRGKTLGIIGMGKIGARVCTLARAFEMNVIAFDPCEIPPNLPEQLGFKIVSFEELLAGSDIISLHVNLSPVTHHLLNRETLAKCREGALIINTARGRLIDTPALQEALESGQIGGAGLDVLEEESVMRQPASAVISDQILEHLRSDVEPERVQHSSRLRDLEALVGSEALLGRPNVVFTPHVAFNSVEAIDRILQETARNIRAFLAGAPVNVFDDAVR
jgi:D-lactate dehydrogenase